MQHNSRSHLGEARALDRGIPLRDGPRTLLLQPTCDLKHREHKHVAQQGNGNAPDAKLGHAEVAAAERRAGRWEGSYGNECPLGKSERGRLRRHPKTSSERPQHAGRLSHQCADKLITLERGDRPKVETTTHHQNIVDSSQDLLRPKIFS